MSRKKAEKIAVHGFVGLICLIIFMSLIFVIDIDSFKLRASDKKKNTTKNGSVKLNLWNKSDNFNIEYDKQSAVVWRGKNAEIYYIKIDE